MVAVIGASGFIGTYLIDALLEINEPVIATGRNIKAKQYYESRGVEYIDLDISNKEDFKKLESKGIEAMVLLAALLPANSLENDPYDYVNININGTLNCLEFCRNNNINKFITTASYQDVRNFWNKNTPVDSDSLRSYPLHDDHAAYIISKNAASDFVLLYNEQYGLHGSIFRLPMVYGFGPHSELFSNGKWYKSGFQIFVDKAIVGEDIEIYGDKDIIRDVVYVKDVADAFIKAIKSDNAKGTYNISSGVGISLEEQVKATIQVYSQDKVSKIIHRPERKNNSASFVLSIDKARRDFGYEPKYYPFEKLLKDYKKEEELKRFPHLTNNYKK